MKTINKLLATVLVSTLLATSAGCYGKFALTRKVYAFNGSVSSNAFVNSLVMWGLLIIPVYELSSVADLFILNTIEVLTGSNPVSIREQNGTVEIQRRGVAWQLVPSGERSLTVYRNGVLRGRVELAPDGRAVVEDLGGRELARVAAASGRY